MRPCATPICARAGPLLQLRRVDAPVDAVLPRTQSSERLLSVLAHELDANAANAHSQQTRQRIGSLLRFVMEHRVAAPHVDDHRMLLLQMVLHRDLVALARPAARMEVAPIAEQVRVEAVLGVERRDAVMHDDGDAALRRRVEQRHQLRFIEVERRGHGVERQR